MFPFTLVLVLIIYGEFCKDLETRYVARLLQYALAFTFLSQYLLTPEYSLLFSAALPVAISLYTVTNTKSKMVRLCFGWVAVFTSLLCYSLYHADPSILPWDFVHNYSHRILRESIIFGLASLAFYNKAKNHELINWFVGILVYIEYLTL